MWSLINTYKCARGARQRDGQQMQMLPCSRYVACNLRRDEDEACVMLAKASPCTGVAKRQYAAWLLTSKGGRDAIGYHRVSYYE